MNLGVIETHLLRALRGRFTRGVDLHAGPAHLGPATGIRAQVFVHAARYVDHGVHTDEGARIGRRAFTLSGDVRGFAEERSASIDIDVTCTCATHTQAQTLAGLVTAPLLLALETLQGVQLGDPTDATQRLTFTDHEASVAASSSERVLHDGVAAASVLTTVRLRGFLHVRLARPGGLARTSAYDLPLRLTLSADPAGTDLQQECVTLHNDGDVAVDLGGWCIVDAAPKRPHRYQFARGRMLPPRGALRLWSGRGNDDAANLHWGRRQAVWTNEGDVARLLDPEGAERARVDHVPQVSAPTPRRPRRPPR